MLTVLFHPLTTFWERHFKLKAENESLPRWPCLPIQVTALGAAVAAGVTAGVWKLGQKMGDITVYRWSLQIECCHLSSSEDGRIAVDCKKGQNRLSHTWAQVWNWRKGTGEENKTVENGRWEESWLGSRGHEHRWLERISTSCNIRLSEKKIEIRWRHGLKAL